MTYQIPITPGSIRLIVDAEDLPKIISHVLVVKHIPKWLAELDECCTVPMNKGTQEGGEIASEMFDVAVQGGADTMACLAALWIAMHGPAPNSITMNQLRTVAGHGVLRIRVSRDRTSWTCQLEHSRDDHDRYNIVPH